MCQNTKRETDVQILANLPATYAELIKATSLADRTIDRALQRMRIAGQIEYDYIRKRGYVWRLVK